VGDVQLLGIASLVPCAPARARAAAEGAAKTLAPLTLTPSSSGKLLGLGVIVLGVAFVQGAALLFARARRGFLRGASLVRWPSLTFTVWNFAMQGWAIEAFRQFHGVSVGAGGQALDAPTASADDSLLPAPTLTDKMFAAAAVLLFLVGFLAVVFWRRLVLPTGEFREYTFAPPKLPAALRPFLPVGYWVTPDFKAANSSLMNAFLPETTWLVYLGGARAFLIGVVATFNAVTQTQCELQFLGLGIVSAVNGVVIAAKGKLRYPVMRPVQAVTSLVASCVLASPGSTALQPHVPTLLTAAAGLSLLSGILQVAQALFERFKVQKLEAQLAAEVVNSSPTTDATAVQVDAKKTGEQDEEMKLLAPLLQGQPESARALLTVAAAATATLNRKERARASKLAESGPPPPPPPPARPGK
jgi:hypothetical protein